MIAIRVLPWKILLIFLELAGIIAMVLNFRIKSVRTKTIAFALTSGLKWSHDVLQLVIVSIH